MDLTGGGDREGGEREKEGKKTTDEMVQTSVRMKAYNVSVNTML